MNPLHYLWIIPAAIAAGLILLRIVYKRSVMATVCEWYLRAANKHETREETELQMQKLAAEEEPVYEIPRGISFHYPVKTEDRGGMRTFTIGGGDKGAVIYLHGGGYVRYPLRFHWSFLNKLAKKTGNKIVVPIYPKAPWNSYDKSYELCTQLYLELKKEGKKVTMMGDSSGGGLALGLCEYFREKGIEQPDELVLLAPWTDVTLSNPDIPKYEKVDPRLNVAPARVWGEAWAGGADLRDYRVSPLYGDVTGLCNVTVIVGTHDILYPDCLVLAEKLKSAGVPCDVIVGKNLDHVYPVYPMPEAAAAVNQIADIVKR